MYRLSDAESGISARELQALFSSLSLGFSPADVAKLYSHASGGNPTLSAAAFASTFTLPPEELVASAVVQLKAKFAELNNSLQHFDQGDDA